MRSRRRRAAANGWWRATAADELLSKFGGDKNSNPSENGEEENFGEVARLRRTPSRNLQRLRRSGAAASSAASRARAGGGSGTRCEVRLARGLAWGDTERRAAIYLGLGTVLARGLGVGTDSTRRSPARLRLKEKEGKVTLLAGLGRSASWAARAQQKKRKGETWTEQRR